MQTVGNKLTIIHVIWKSFHTIYSENLVGYDSIGHYGHMMSDVSPRKFLRWQRYAHQKLGIKIQLSNDSVNKMTIFQILDSRLLCNAMGHPGWPRKYPL